MGFSFCLFFILEFISGGMHILGCTTGKAFAQASDQKTLSAQMKELELKLKTIDKDYLELKKEIIAVKQDIAKNKIESIASNKLLEVSEKNLTAPTWVIGVLIGLIVAISGIISILIFIIRKGILDKIHEEINKINATWEAHKKESQEAWKTQKDESDIIKRDVVRSLAFDFNVAMVDAWERKRLDQAIKLGESAVKYGVEAFGENPKDYDDQLVLDRIRSNLAYVYAERNRTDKAQQAIEYAKNGLETGRAVGYLDLIDNFLFVIKVFSRTPTDRNLWKEIYEEYKDEIYRNKIREGEEQEEFDKFYKELK